MQCACGSQDGEYKSGISKKNGKPWKGWKCKQCDQMQFMPTQNFAPKTAAPQTTQAQPPAVNNTIIVMLNSIDDKLNKLLARTKNELEPDQEVPF